MSGYCYKWEHKYDQHLIYVGSTEDIKQREREHRSACHNPSRREYNKPFYKHVRKYGTIDQWEMTELYKGPDFRLFEKNYIKSTWEYNLNDEIPLRTKQEKKDFLQAYREANKEEINEYNKAYYKAYYKANKDKISEKAREKIPCDICGKFISKANICVHKKTKKCMAFKS
jgi:hypothetical protein